MEGSSCGVSGFTFQCESDMLLEVNKGSLLERVLRGNNTDPNQKCNADFYSLYSIKYILQIYAVIIEGFVTFFV